MGITGTAIMKDMAVVDPVAAVITILINEFELV
jgi:hypothetical protein